jgi:ribosomal protein L39E
MGRRKSIVRLPQSTLTRMKSDDTSILNNKYIDRKMRAFLQNNFTPKWRIIKTDKENNDVLYNYEIKISKVKYSSPNIALCAFLTYIHKPYFVA